MIFFLLFMPAVYWCYDQHLGIRLALILIISKGLNEILKVAFHSPRPYWVTPDTLPAGALCTGHGMIWYGLGEVGHVQDAMVFMSSPT